MVSQNENEYRPDYVIPPGETLLETINAIGMSQAQLAERTGRPRKTINEIIKGKTAITPETALQLERVLRVPASLWNTLEHQYRTALARLEEQNRLAQQVEWLKSIPVPAMIKLGRIAKEENKIQQLQEVLNFFGVASPERWDEIWQSTSLAFRKSHAFEVDSGAMAAWLRMGEVEAQSIVCAPYNEKAFRSALDKIRALTVEPPQVFCPALERLCAEAGVACVLIPPLPRIRVSGATRWLTPKKALIQLSLRYKTDDHLWFSFFHEAAHILLHAKRVIFIDAIGRGEPPEEEEANNFAANMLIPQTDLNRFMLIGDKSKGSIGAFARELGISPGIVVGQLQHGKYLPMSHCNDLKVKFEWAA